MFDDGLLLSSAVNGGPVNGFGVDISEEDALILHIKVNGDHVAQVLVDDRVLFGIDRYVAHVVFIGEYEPRLRHRVLAFACVFVWFAFVVCLITFAIVRAWCVGAVLGAHAGHFLIIYIISVN